MRKDRKNNQQISNYNYQQITDEVPEPDYLPPEVEERIAMDYQILRAKPPLNKMESIREEREDELITPRSPRTNQEPNLTSYRDMIANRESETRRTI